MKQPDRYRTLSPMEHRAAYKKTSEPFISHGRMTRAAYRYLERFASTEVQLVRVLHRMVERSRRKSGEDIPDEAIEAARQLAVDVAARCRGLGLVNDRLFAMARARRLHLRGKPVKIIRAALREKGVAPVDISAALEELAVDIDDVGLDYQAALVYARRRRFGAFRLKPVIDAGDQRRKELAAMARAGFSYDTACQVLDIMPGQIDDDYEIENG